MKYTDAKEILRKHHIKTNNLQTKYDVELIAKKLKNNTL